MKKAIATFALIGLTAAISACETTEAGNVETDAPYAMERTATGGAPAAMNEQVVAHDEVQSGDQVFRKAQTK